MTQTLRSADLLNTFGVDTHVEYSDSAYANLKLVTSELSYLGVNQVREGVAPLSSLLQLAKTGVQFTIGIGSPRNSADLQQVLSSIDALEKAAPGSVAAVEGANEFNNYPFAYNGVDGLQGALNLQQALYSGVHSDPTLAGVAVDYFTGYGDGAIAIGPDPSSVAGLADFDNQHPYPLYGAPPGPVILPANVLNNEGSVKGPAVYTETGYPTVGYGLVSEDVQAKYTLDLLLDAAADGIAHTYLYQLMDGYALGSPQGDDGYGVFNIDGSPKLVATAIHNLTSILADTSGSANSFTTGSLAYSAIGLPPTGRTLELQKSDGTFDIVVWSDPAIWNPVTNSETSVSSSNVTVELGATFQSLSIFDPMVGTTPIQTFSNASSVTLAVTDHPLILQVNSPVAGGTPTGGTPTGGTPTGGTDTGSNLLVNGSFEQGPSQGDFATIVAGASGLTGWNVTQGNIEDIGAYWQAADGSHSLDMSGSTAGAIAQTFATTAGQVYDVTFDLAGNPDDVLHTVHSLNVSAAGQSQTFSFDAKGHSRSAMGWTQEVFQFTAASSSTVLQFTSLDNSPYGPTLDNVSVTSTTGGSGPVPVSDTTAPDTSLTSTPPAQSTSSSATFNFTGSDNVGGTGVTYFQGSLDGSAFATAVSGVTYANLSNGSHTFAVRAVDAAGNIDPSPATYTWQVNAASAPTGGTPTGGTPTGGTPTGGTDTGSNLLVNGSFEQGPSQGDFATIVAGASGLTGWNVTQGNIEDIGAYWQAADGSHSLDMSGSTAGAIAQTFATTAGQVYDVTFDLAGNPDDVLHTVHSLNVSAAGQSQTFSFDAKGHSRSAMGWTQEVFQFTAASSSTVLQFTSLDNSPYGPTLDNVSVTSTTGGSGPVPVSDTTAPDTSLTSTPPAQSTSSSATFNFTGSDNVGGTGVTYFQGSLDGSAFATAVSGVTYANLSNGSHTFAVRAVDAAGNIDPSPATYTWQVNAASAPTGGTPTGGTPTGGTPTGGTDTGSNLLVNGSFEQGPSQGDFATIVAGASGLTGWNVTQGNIEDIGAYWQAADGSHSLDMSGSTAGAIAQTFATTAGQVYDVTFDLAGNPDDVLHTVHSLNVSAAGQSQTFSFDAKGHSRSAMGWTQEVFQFTAASSSTVLQFTSLDNSPYGPTLDNVSVNLFNH